MFGNQAAYFATPSMTTSSLGPNDPKVGDIRRYDDEDYRFVYNAGNSTIGVGKLATLSAVTGYSVTVSTITGSDIAVGVCKHESIATGYYGWLMTRGFSTVQMEASNSAAAGQILAVAADGTVAMKSSVTAFTGAVIGKAMEAIASGASGMAYISIF